MGDTRSSDFRFRSILGELTLRQLWAWDFLGAFTVAAVVTTLTMVAPADGDLLRSIAGDLLQVLGGIFGIVLAAFGIVTAVLGDRLSGLLEKSALTPRDLLSGFLLAAWILVLSMLTHVGFLLFSKPLESASLATAELAFGVAFLMFTWSLFASLEMLRYVLAVVSLTAEVPGPPTSPRADGD